MNRPFTSILEKILNFRSSYPEAFLVFQQHPESSDAPLVAVTRTEFDARSIEKQQLSVRPTYRVMWERFTVPDARAVGDGDQLFIVFEGKRTRHSHVSADRNPAPLGVFATEKAAREVKGAKYLRTVTVGWQDLSVWDHLD
ncbi:hypothetical protein M3B51_08680 [Kocuria carniphila]|uniref:hypothetical protein n=1 Tax=Kocuria carniphila TaxID=262208 RepID=UPI0021A3ABBB|nr:hypothetical protein [Kocuria carniphila]MCT1802864.1 hypothetical protein [Kocuria carniphila]